MAFSFAPVKFIRSNIEFSNLINENPSIEPFIPENDAIPRQISSRIIQLQPKPLTGIEAHSFYVSLFSPIEDSADSICSPDQSDTPEIDLGSRSIHRQSPTSDQNSEKSKLILTTKTTGSSIRKSSPKKIVPVDILRNRFLKAASTNDLDNLEKCLSENHQILNLTDEFGWSALMCAAYDGHYDVTEFLLRQGADFSMRNQQNRSALNIARRRGHRKIADLLEAAENFMLQESSQSSMAGSESESADMEDKETFCEICSITYKDPNHETSTAHLLKAAPMADPDDQPDQRPSYILPHSNRGYQLMLKDGWDWKRGLGRHGQGRWYPVKTILKRDRRGLGSANAPKPRVTHFGAHDSRAIERNGRAEKRLVLKSAKVTKKERLRKEAEEKEWVKNFMRDFY